MAITCIFPAALCNTSPTLPAISPEIPLSISSKIIVGRSFRSEMSDFSASITLESSPPEATLLRSAGSCPRLAENLNTRLSIPSRPGTPNLSLWTLKLASLSPIFFNISKTSSQNGLKEPALNSDRWIASDDNFCSFCSSSLEILSRSDLSVAIPESLVSRSFITWIKEDTEDAPCLCCNFCMKSNLSVTAWSCSGSCSVFSFSLSRSWVISFNSIIIELSLSDSFSISAWYLARPEKSLWISLSIPRILPSLFWICSPALYSFSLISRACSRILWSFSRPSSSPSDNPAL